jgi:hypothetical protein
MPFGNFIKQNFALFLGLTLPVLLMAFFFLATMMPQIFSDLPKYDMVFSSPVYDGNITTSFSLNFLVKDHILKVQYVRYPTPTKSNEWRKLYIYEAKTQKIRELPFGIPADLNKIVHTRQDIVEATKGLKLDSNPQAPDGYTLLYPSYSHSGFINEVFWGGSYSGEVQLRKGSASFNLPNSVNNIEFIGWVTP